MIEKFLKAAGWMTLCGMLILVQPKEVLADQPGTCETSTQMLVKVDADDIVLYGESYAEAEVIATLEKDSIYQIEMTTPSGWLRVTGAAGTGYIDGNEEFTIVESVQEESAEEIAKKKSESRRQSLVEYALQFLGGRYVYGGNDPHSGVDCSGFTRYILQHGAGVGLNRSAAAQASQGRAVSVDEMRPGDLIFYGSGKRINHVAMYIGNGTVVHASTERTGIKTSPWNYRTPVAIRNVLGD